MNQENTSAPAENKMGTMPIGKLLFNMSLPMMISMLVQALYNIVDSIFVAKLSENALTAVSLAFPLQTLLIAVGTGTGVGMNALLSKSLGEKNFKKANATASNAAILYFFSYLVFFILGFTIVRPFYASQIGNADQEIMELGIEYLSTVMIFSFGLLAQVFFERLLTSTGRTIFSMTSQLTGAITNIILDPILIFGLLGAPKMGVTGAAVATVIGQCVAALVAGFCNHRYNHDVKLKFHGFRLDFHIIGTIYAVGIPTIIMVLKRTRSDSDILIIDASKKFEKVGKNNKLRARDIREIVDTLKARKSVTKFAKLVTKDDIRKNEYNLNIPRYVDSSDDEEPWDIHSIMFGGIFYHLSLYKKSFITANCLQFSQEKSDWLK